MTYGQKNPVTSDQNSILCVMNEIVLNKAHNLLSHNFFYKPQKCFKSAASSPFSKNCH